MTKTSTLTTPNRVNAQMLHFILASAMIFTAIVSSELAVAEEPVSKSYFGGVAIDGHDSVAYHHSDTIEQHIATKGDPSLTVNYKGAVWRFASEQSRDQFSANPEKYAPAYNGHCANALSLGEGLIKTDGTHWEIFDDKLYLFYAPRGRNRWLNAEDYRVYKVIADQAWQALIQ